MAYDPEARRQSNSALIIAVVSALVLGGGLLAYMATRNNTPEPGPTTVINAPARERTVVVNNTVPVPVEVPATPNVVVRDVPQTVVVQPAPGNTTTRVVERNSTTVRDRVIAPRPATGGATSGGAASGASGPTAPAPQSNTNVTINNAPPANPDASTDSTGSTSADNAAASATDTAPATGTVANSASGGY